MFIHYEYKDFLYQAYIFNKINSNEQSINLYKLIIYYCNIINNNIKTLILNDCTKNIKSLETEIESLQEEIQLPKSSVVSIKYLKYKYKYLMLKKKLNNFILN